MTNEVAQCKALSSSYQPAPLRTAHDTTCQTNTEAASHQGQSERGKRLPEAAERGGSASDGSDGRGCSGLLLSPCHSYQRIALPYPRRTRCCPASLPTMPPHAMPSDFTSWFDESSFADTRVRAHCQRPCRHGTISADTLAQARGKAEAAAQGLEADQRTPGGTQRTKHAHTGSGPGLDSRQDTLPAQWPVRTYHVHAIILSAQSAYFAACLGTNWTRLGLQQQGQGQQGDAPAGLREASMIGLMSARSNLFRSSRDYLSKGWQRLSCAALAAAAAAVAASATATAWQIAVTAVTKLRWAIIAAGALAVVALLEMAEATTAGLVIAATALFTGATLATAMGATTAAPAVGVTIDVTLQPHELDAMDLILQFMYGFDLPAVSPQTIPTLIHCLLLADRFDVPKCVDALLTHIKGTAASVELFCAPPGIKGRPDFAAFLETAKSYVVDAYGDVPAVIRSDRLRQKFCSLPFAAVRAWAESDKLQVQSENCVVYLLSTWVQATQRVGGQGVSADQLEQLAQRVRVLHLGPAYQHHILPQLGWFKGCSCMAHLPTLLAYKGKNKRGRTVFLADGAELTADDQTFPERWVAQARQESSADQVLSWEVAGWQLQQLCKGKRTSSPPLYINGFMLTVQADAQITHRGATRALAMYVGIDPGQTDGAVPWPATASVTVGPVDVMLLHGPGPGVSLSCPAFVQMGLRGRKAGNLLSRSVPSMSDLLTPYLKDGKLHMEAELTTVDAS